MFQIEENMQPLVSEQIKFLKDYFIGRDKIVRNPDGSFQFSFDNRDLSGLNTTLLSKSLIDLIKDTLIKNEKIIPGSSSTTIDLLEQLYTDDKQELDKRVAVLNNVLSNIHNFVTQIDRPLLRNVIKEYTTKELNFHLLNEAIKLAGSSSKIIVERTLGVAESVEKNLGYNFQLNIDPFFQTNKTTFFSPKCLVIDGVIDSVSEIDTLLTKISEAKSTLFIFARGFSHEVLSTLKLNFKRKTLSVIPVKVDLEFGLLNVVNDLAVVIDTDIITPLKGDVISTVKYEDLHNVEKIVVKGNSISIFNPNSNSRVFFHLNRLKERLEEATIPDTKNAISNRINSLSSSTVYIRVPIHNLEKNTHQFYELNKCLKIIENCMRFGVVESKKIRKMLNIKLDKKYTPVYEIITAIQSVVSLSKVLSNIQYGISIS